MFCREQVAQLRDRLPELRAAGANVAVIGNGSAEFARAFRDDLALGDDVSLLVDPELRSYRAAEMRRGRSELLSPRLASNALRAMREGYRQGAVQGDPFQLGGVLVIRPDGALTYRHVSRVAGDHPPLDEVIAALAPGAAPLAEQPRRSRVGAIAARALSRVLDPTILLSFDRTGFARHARCFDPDDLARDLTGRRIVITGANSGIGFAAALALADLGADVVLACRSEERGLAARDEIRAQSGNARVSLERLDVASLTDVRAFAARLAGQRLDVLIHNAGVLPGERSETGDGIETVLATHVAGPHLLTRLLEPALARSDDARVIWVSSGGMYTRRLDLGDPQWRKRRYDGVLAYAETKRMQVALAQEWARRSEKSGLRVVSMHPGWADTPAVAQSLPRFRRVTEAILRTPAEGADTVVWLAAAPRERLEPGGFYFDRERRSPHLLPWTRESARERAALWRFAEGLVKPPAARKARAR
jgi:NAD(P)-dependent dehydrogenase (short-subunit alcohol dehydrogenase family)